MIFVVAAYSPPTGTHPGHLGGARKIESVIKILHKVDPDIVLINSVDFNSSRDFLLQNCSVAGLQIRSISFPGFGSAINKLRNIFFQNRLLDFLKNFEAPRAVWLYNAYAFEMSFLARFKSLHPNTKAILEFEDWHFSRASIVSIKPLLDFFAWKMFSMNLDYAFCVNGSLLAKMKGQNIRGELFPGLVSDDILEAKKIRNLFSDANNITVGYFGGLDSEKGADFLLKLIQASQKNIKFYVTGSGELETEFRDMAAAMPLKLNFASRIPSSEIGARYAACDIVINPHSTSEKLLDGVFPFKVIEGVGSGRVVLSTLLREDGVEQELSCILYYDGSVIDALEKINYSSSWYKENATKFNLAVSSVCAKYSVDAVGGRVLEVI